MLERNAPPEVYRRDIDDKLEAATAKAAADNIQFGALIIEPVVMGAGGMLLVDPLYQRVLVQVDPQWNVDNGLLHNTGIESHAWIGFLLTH